MRINILLKLKVADMKTLLMKREKNEKSEENEFHCPYL